MQSRLRRGGRTGSSHPLQNITQSVGTSQGRYTFYAITALAILGVVLHKPMIFLVQTLNPSVPPKSAEELAISITVGLCVVLLVVSLLKMQSVMGAIENRRVKAFSERMAKRREADRADG